MKPEPYERESTAYIKNVVLAHSSDECLKWPFSISPKGYARYNQMRASRYICELVNGPPPHKSYHAAHSCGKGHEACVSPLHLSWKTPQQNQDDRKLHGTSCRGQANPKAKLTDKDVAEIKSLFPTHGNVELAAMFGVSRHTVWDIRRGRKWGHINPFQTPEESREKK